MTVQSPIPDFAVARTAMVESQLRPQGVADPAVIEAMRRVPREKFLPPETRPLAYADRAVLMGDGRFLPAPAVLGALLTQMMPRPGQRALVVGAGTGYSAAVLQAMGLAVTALESSSTLACAAREQAVDDPSDRRLAHRCLAREVPACRAAEAQHRAHDAPLIRPP